MPQPANPTSSFTAVYDAWKRMTAIGAGTPPVGKYQYDGRGFRIVKLDLHVRDRSPKPGTSTSQTLARHRAASGSSSLPDQQHVWGIRYIDELLCRDDSSPLRLYALHDPNFSVTALVDNSGNVLERIVYQPYGESSIRDSTWTLTVDEYGWLYRHQGCAFGLSDLYTVRYRVRSYGLGLWLQRDPDGYADTANAYQCLRSQPFHKLDPLGLWTYSGTGYGLFNNAFTGPGSYGPQTTDLTVLWYPDKAKMAALCCVEVNFVQIYKYTESSLMWPNGITVNAWDWDSAGTFYPHTTPGTDRRPAAMVDTPGWESQPWIWRGALRTQQHSMARLAQSVPRARWWDQVMSLRSQALFSAAFPGNESHLCRRRHKKR